jgi:anti-sigma regulatory factor (Ser/Thr protein kinase)
MDSPADFFVSYTSVDRTWAEWIAWQLEAEGYQVVVQAWDFGVGSDWAHQMQHATSTAGRLVAVLSPDYLASSHGEAEWRVFYDRDPSGERGLLLPVRVREVDPPGLLKTRVYVDLVHRDVVSAREALLAAIRQVRGKPIDEPEFPGDRERPVGNGNEQPQFPGDLPFDSAGNELPAEATVTLHANDARAIKAYVTQASASLRRRHFTHSDIEAFKLSLQELVYNAARHVKDDDTVDLRLSYVEEVPLMYQYAMNLDVTDRGKGFDFHEALLRSEAELADRGLEHGLLRAYRLGSMLSQNSTLPHRMSWMRERMWHTVPTVFGGKLVIPFVFSFDLEAILIWKTVHTFCQFEEYFGRSPAFMDLIFDPLQRPARKYVGIEIVGFPVSVMQIDWPPVLDRLLSFAKRNTGFDKQFLLFADTVPSFHRELRKYCSRAGIVMFEDESTIRKLKETDVSRRIRKAKRKKAG